MTLLDRIHTKGFSYEGLQEEPGPPPSVTSYRNHGNVDSHIEVGNPLRVDRTTKDVDLLPVLPMTELLSLLCMSLEVLVSRTLSLTLTNHSFLRTPKRMDSDLTEWD